MSWISTFAIGVALACAGTIVAGLLRLQAAGRAEGLGRLHRARVLARESVPWTGLGMLGSVGTLLVTTTTGATPRPWIPSAALLALALAGGTGALAGLSGKPRPSVVFAWILLGCSTALAAIAVGAAAA